MIFSSFIILPNNYWGFTKILLHSFHKLCKETMGRSRMKDTSQTIPFNTNNIIACKRFMEAKIDGILIIMCRKIRLILVCLIAISSLQSQAQALYGTTGLLHAPHCRDAKRQDIYGGRGMCCILFHCSISIAMR